MSKKYGYPIKQQHFDDTPPKMKPGVKIMPTDVMKGEGGTEYFPNQNAPVKGEGGTQKQTPNTPSYINKTGRGGTSKNY